MIGEILQAVMDECKEFLKDQGGTFILKTDYRTSKLASYAMPLFLFDLVSAPDSDQWLGGATNMGWLFGMNGYNYEPNAHNEDDGGYSSNLINFVDDLRTHFSKTQFLTQGMADILTKYCFKFTLSGIVPADALPIEDGLVMGYRIVFDSISIDNSTNGVQYSAETLQHVVQLCYPPS